MEVKCPCHRNTISVFKICGFSVSSSFFYSVAMGRRPYTLFLPLHYLIIQHMNPKCGAWYSPDAGHGSWLGLFYVLMSVPLKEGCSIWIFPDLIITKIGTPMQMGARSLGLAAELHALVILFNQQCRDALSHESFLAFLTYYLSSSLNWLLAF